MKKRGTIASIGTDAKLRTAVGIYAYESAPVTELRKRKAKKRELSRGWI
jgi:hypothetical protein